MASPNMWRQEIAQNGKMDGLKVLFVGPVRSAKGDRHIVRGSRACPPDKLSVRCAGDAVVSGGKLRDNPPRMSKSWVGCHPPSCRRSFWRRISSRCHRVGKGLGIAAIEAMRAAKPIVASDIGGLREVVDNGITGLAGAGG